ncbi:MAG: DUF2062 domain-containing protein [Rhizobiaceae bacterium]|nr:DUF2062 domain-containing protein [Rhizobiaceae bacterium]MCV0408053.1 DUF2062 domain-containing protein [Rhizobiaceae bacterium]
MLFRRRRQDDLWGRARVFMWPRRSFARSARYFAKRVLRLSAEPHAVAAGVAAGVFASFLPYPGTHFLIAAAVAWIIGGNLLASALGTAVGNPLTFPFMWGAGYELGRFILEGRAPEEPRLDLWTTIRHLEFGELWGPLLKPATIGALPLGLAAGLVFYIITRQAVATFRDQRQKRLAEKALRRAQLGDRVPARG